MNHLKWLVVCLSGLVITALVIVGHNWQLIPLYICLSFVLVQLAINPFFKRKILVYSVISLLLAITATNLYILPVFKLPVPKGNYAVGVRYATIRTQRAERFTANVDDHRTLYTKIWYPAKNVNGLRTNAYIEGGGENVKLLAKLAKVPPFLMEHLPKTKTHGYTNAPIAAGSFPFLTFSHGYGSWFGQNTVLMEELASRGFIVVSIAHSYQTLFTASDENSIVRFSEVVSLDSSTNDTTERVMFDKFIQANDTTTFSKLFYELILRKPSINQYASVWAQDIQSVIDFIVQENRNEKSTFHQHVDTLKIGSFGMSFGGAASGEAALRDARIKAAMNMDGTQYGMWVSDTLRVPFLFLEAQRSPYFYSMYAPLKWRTKKEYHALLFKDAAHYNFTDVNLFSPAFIWMGILGSIDRSVMMQSMNEIVPDFFTSVFSDKPFREEKYLKERSIMKPNF